MTTSLHAMSVLTFLQTLRAVAGTLERAARHCAETGTDPDAFVSARLYPDMAPFHFQIESLKNHTVWGLEAVRTGAFTPPPLLGAVPFSALRAHVTGAITALEALSPSEVNRRAGKALDIEIFLPVDPENASTSAWAPRTMTFTPESFLLNYTQPNVYFHAVTAHNILRTQGVPIGKGDYLGQMRTGSA
jgi:hypothetical protein